MAANPTTASGNITIDAQGNDTDIIFKRMVMRSFILTISGSEVVKGIFSKGIYVNDITITTLIMIHNSL